MFALTGDQDWTPDWALEATLDLAAAHGVPFHLFVTNHSPLLSHPSVTLGIHPNFLEGSTHGATRRHPSRATLFVPRSCSRPGARLANLPHVGTSFIGFGHDPGCCKHRRVTYRSPTNYTERRFVVRGHTRSK